MDELKGTNLRYGTTPVRDFLHMTGGLRGAKTGGGWLIGPLPGEAEPHYIGPVPDLQVGAICAQLGIVLFGTDDISGSESLLPFRVWTPLLGLPRLSYQAADTWAWIKHSAGAAGDNDYAALARNVSVSLRAAGIRLRDASDQYHAQLVAALDQKKRPGRFQNIAVADLHLAYHSLAAELASVRDYLASIAARQVGAPDEIDALSRLARWVQKPAGRATANDPLVRTMLDAWEKAKPDSWLWDLTDYRNVFLHSKPLATDEHAQWLSLIEKESAHGKVMLIQMQMPIRSDSSETCEGLQRFVDLHARMCRLADFAATQAKFHPKIPHVDSV